ncbi:hypothetical protein UYO_2298 [Lachnospiraceae bacterium JC7]|nr:hypothetical protein UYO_2298 [Lachnospiraceae bacterium JC7]
MDMSIFSLSVFFYSAVRRAFNDSVFDIHHGHPLSRRHNLQKVFQAYNIIKKHNSLLRRYELQYAAKAKLKKACL